MIKGLVKVLIIPKEDNTDTHPCNRQKQNLETSHKLPSLNDTMGFVRCTSIFKRAFMICSDIGMEFFYTISTINYTVYTSVTYGQPVEGYC